MKYLPFTRAHVFAGALLATTGFAFGPWGPVSAPTADARSFSHGKRIGHVSGFHGRSAFRNRGFRNRGFFGGHRDRSFFGVGVGFGSRFGGGFGVQGSFGGHRGFGVHSGFSGHGGFGGHSGVVYTPPPRTVYVDRPRTVVVPSTPIEAAPVYSGVSLDDAWSLLEGGRFAMAQNAFAQIATNNPDKPEPKVGYGLAAIFNGSYDLGENAFLRANTVDPNIWERLEHQPVVRAAAIDLSKNADVQQSDVLREATRRLAGPDDAAYPPAGSQPAAESTPADGSKPADHDYETTGN